jgi:hypothetical protein
MDSIRIKIVMPQQAKSTIKYKSTKLKLLQTNTTIWFNMICSSKHLTPNEDGIVLPKHVAAIVKEK